MKKKWYPALIVIVIALIAAFVLAPLRHPKTATASAAVASARIIKVGTNRALGTVAPYVARDKHFFQEHGVNVEIVDFADGSTLMEAFASGQLDVALLGIAPSAIWQNKGVDLKVVASANGGGHVLLTRADTGIHDIEELRGKKVATPKPGTVVDTLFRAHIARELAKLDPDKDIQIVPDVAPADMPTALFVAREVDAAITWEPFATLAETKYKDSKVLFDAAAEWHKANPNSKHFYPVSVVIARQSFIQSRPEDLRHFLAAYVQTIDFVNNRPDEADGIIASEINLDKTIVDQARLRIDYTAQVDTAAALQTLEWSKQLGYLKEVPTANKLFDLSYLPPGKDGR